MTYVKDPSPGDGVTEEEMRVSVKSIYVHGCLLWSVHESDLRRSGYSRTKE